MSKDQTQNPVEIAEAELDTVAGGATYMNKLAWDPALEQVSTSEDTTVRAGDMKWDNTKHVAW